MAKRGCIIVTYRDRQVHLDCFLLYMNRYFSHLPIIVAEQADKEVWNKGLLYNTAFIAAGAEYDYIILHDVDFLPARNVDYSYTPEPTLLSTECSQFGYSQCYPTFFGGVVGMTREHYILINGFSNKFRGWGAEDDNLRHRCIAAGLEPVKRTGNRFENFTHPRLDVLGGDRNNPDYLHNLEILQQPIDPSDGLSGSVYSAIVSDKQHKECRHIRIATS